MEMQLKSQTVLRLALKTQTQSQKELKNFSSNFSLSIFITYKGIFGEMPKSWSLNEIWDMNELSCTTIFLYEMFTYLICLS